mmetsp:Transcript_16412/g.53453  ORF Transcript_16412/g.53453 Transcript_16412/m.53453 type:complete len:290 (-) Transcript_16412:223-1092(-)
MRSSRTARRRSATASAAIAARMRDSARRWSSRSTARRRRCPGRSTPGISPSAERMGRHSIRIPRYVASFALSPLRSRRRRPEIGSENSRRGSGRRAWTSSARRRAGRTTPKASSSRSRRPIASSRRAQLGPTKGLRSRTRRPGRASLFSARTPARTTGSGAKASRTGPLNRRTTFYPPFVPSRSCRRTGTCNAMTTIGIETGPPRRGAAAATRCARQTCACRTAASNGPSTVILSSAFAWSTATRMTTGMIRRRPWTARTRSRSRTSPTPGTWGEPSTRCRTPRSSSAT